MGVWSRTDAGHIRSHPATSLDGADPDFHIVDHALEVVEGRYAAGSDIDGAAAGKNSVFALGANRRVGDPLVPAMDWRV
jgi:hypothetical protein